MDLHQQLVHKELVPQGDSYPLHLLANEGQEEGERLLWQLLELPPGPVCPPLHKPLELGAELLEV